MNTTFDPITEKFIEIESIKEFDSMKSVIDDYQTDLRNSFVKYGMGYCIYLDVGFFNIIENIFPNYSFSTISTVFIRSNDERI